MENSRGNDPSRPPPLPCPAPALSLGINHRQVTCPLGHDVLSVNLVEVGIT